MDQSALEELVGRLVDFASMDGRSQVDHFAYFLCVQGGLESCTARDIQQCFEELSMRPYSRIAAYLSEEAKKRSGRYVKVSHGYKLERRAAKQIGGEQNHEPERVKVSRSLQDLVDAVTDADEKEFLLEAIACYGAKAYRATVMLVWIVSMYHLQKYIFDNALLPFNDALSKQKDKKLQRIDKLDDFSDLKESKLIELARSARIINNDVRKILDEKLGIRNSAAHPSGVQLSGHKATEFASDLISNVLLKY